MTSTIIKIESLSHFNLSKSKIKFIEIFTQGSLGTDKEVYKQYNKTLDLAFLYVMYLSHILCISFFILDQ